MQMESFNLITGICSILSLLISILTFRNTSNILKQNIKGDNNTTSGRDSHVRQK